MLGTFWAMYKLNVTGNHPALRPTPFIPMFGFAVGAVFSLLQALGFVDGTNLAFGVFWILVMEGLFMTGIAVLVAWKWTGWRKFAPAACLLVFPVMIQLGSVVGSISNILFSLTQVALGFAVLTSADTPVDRRSIPR